MDFRQATPDDATTVTETISSAFFEDPTWSWAFPDPDQRMDQYREWWRLTVDSSIRLGGCWMSSGAECASTWITPKEPELPPDVEAQVPGMLVDMLGQEHGTEVVGLLEKFDANHPHAEPHYYLSLLATHADHRGRGIGLALLASDLARIDAEHTPAYLEASNPENVPLYERFGFRVVGEFSVPGGPTVVTMWRDPR